MSDTDILQSIPDEDIPKLRELYKKLLPRACYIYNYLESVIKWKTQYPDKSYITVMAPHGNWSTGTFVAIHEYRCYELMMFTLEEDCQTLCKALVNTRKIKWTTPLLLYAIYGDHFPKIMEAVKKTPFQPHLTNPCDVVWIPKEKAINFEINCPPEVRISKLNTSHAYIINSHWPHRSEDSERYISTLIERNGGYGLFLKSDGTLVAWVVRNVLGLSALQTLDEHKRKGYASLLTKILSKEMAEQGDYPVGTVLENNIVSKNMFEKLGFEILDQAIFVESKGFRSNNKQ